MLALMAAPPRWRHRDEQGCASHPAASGSFLKCVLVMKGMVKYCGSFTSAGNDAQSSIVFPRDVQAGRASARRRYPRMSTARSGQDFQRTTMRLPGS